MLGLLENKKMVKPNVQEVIEDFEWDYDEVSDEYILNDISPEQGTALLYEEISSCQYKIHYSFS